MAESWGSIWVVTRFGSSPSNLMNLDAKEVQFVFGYATIWADHVPVAPPNFPNSLCVLIWSICRSNRAQKTANSFPNVVGVAGWPWVSASMDAFLYFRAIFFSSLFTDRSAGKKTRDNPSCHMSE